LTYVGMQLGLEWKNILHYSNYFDVAVILVVIIAIALFLRSRRNKQSNTL